MFRLGDQAKKTKTDHRGGQHPLWDDQVGDVSRWRARPILVFESFMKIDSSFWQVNLVVPEGKTKMIVQLFDEDKRKEDLISEGEVDLTTVLKAGEQDGKRQERTSIERGEGPKEKGNATFIRATRCLLL